MKRNYLLPIITSTPKIQASKIYTIIYRFCFFAFLLMLSQTKVSAQSEDADYEIVSKEDEYKKVCWPLVSTSKTEATTQKAKMDTVNTPSTMSGGLAPARRLYNAVEIPNLIFPNPTIEIYDLLGNPLIINGTTINFSPSTVAAFKADSILGTTNGYHWVGYQSNIYQPDKFATYYYNVFHRWFGGMPCHYESYGGRQWNSDNIAANINNYSDTVFAPHPIFASIIQPINCYGNNNAIIKFNTIPQNFYTFSINSSTATANNTFTSLAAGTYTLTITDSFFNSCDTVITITQPQSLGTKTVITNCGAFTWAASGATYNASGVYFFSTPVGACVKTDTLQLTVTQNTTNPSNITAYNSYTWPVTGLTYTNSGNYFNSATTASGCQVASILSLNIIYTPYNMNLVVDQEISCYNANDGSIQASVTPASFPVMYQLDGGPVFNSTGFFQGLATGTHTVCAISGSISVCKTITLVNPAPLVITLITDSLVSCLGNDGGISATITGGADLMPYFTYWTNSANVLLNPVPNNYDQFIAGLTPGLYKLTVEDDHGCFAMATKVLGAATLSVTATFAPIKCNGGSTNIIPSSIGGIGEVTYKVNGLPLASNYLAGTYMVMATDAKGCTATTMITITEPPLELFSNDATACNSYYWSLNGTTYTSSGNYSQYLTTVSGCAIVGILNLTINNNTTTTTNINACNSYTWSVNGATYTSSGVYTATNLNSTGCLNTATLNLILHFSTTGTKTASACNSYTWVQAGASNPYTASGTYTATSINAFGCVHTATLFLTIYPNTTTSSSITSCNSYTWPANSATYTTSGVYTFTSLNTQNCTQTNTLNLTINNSTSSSQTATACNTFTWTANGQTYTNSGVYAATSLNTQNCIHTTTLNLTINNSTSSSQSATACNTFTWTANGQTYTNSGVYTATSLNTQNCTHTTTLNLTINHTTSSSQTATACNTFTWAANGQTYTTSGVYTFTSINTQNCSNTTTLNLTIKYSTSSNANITATNSYNWSANGATYTSTGNYSATLTNAAGCDSLLSLHLTINASVSTVNLKCYIQGFWDNTNSNMYPVLLNQSQPSLVNECDTIMVELHSTTAPFATLFAAKTVLLRNGQATCSFPTTGTFYLVVVHRNAVQTWSANPVNVGSTPLNYNFSNAANKAFGSNQIQVASGVWAFYSGDINQDENIDLVDVTGFEIDVNNFQSGYIPTDLNGDGNCDLLDAPMLDNNLNDFIYSVHP